MNPSKSIWKFYKLIATDIAVINGRDPVVVSDREIGDNPRAENDLEAENDREVGNDHQDRDSHKMAFSVRNQFKQEHEKWSFSTT